MKINISRSSWLILVGLFLTLCVDVSWAQSQSGSTSDQGSTTTTKKSKKSKKADTTAADASGAPAAAASAPAAGAAPTSKVAPTSAPASSNTAEAAPPTKRSSTKTTPSTVPDSEIAAAKSSGKVWVNLDSGVYHKSGRWYGKTKSGKFMSEDEAKAAGYKASQRN